MRGINENIILYPIQYDSALKKTMKAYYLQYVDGLRSLSKMNQAQEDKHLLVPFSKLVSLKLRIE